MSVGLGSDSPAFFLRSAGKFATSPHPLQFRPSRGPAAPCTPIAYFLPPSRSQGGKTGMTCQVRKTFCAQLCRSSEVQSKARLTLCCASSGRDLRTCSCSRYSATEGSLARTYMLSVNLSVTATRKTTELWKARSNRSEGGIGKAALERWFRPQHNYGETRAKPHIFFYN